MFLISLSLLDFFRAKSMNLSPTDMVVAGLVSYEKKEDGEEDPHEPKGGPFPHVT